MNSFSNCNVTGTSDTTSGPVDVNARRSSAARLAPER